MAAEARLSRIEMDPEAPIRKVLLSKLTQHFRAWEEVPLISKEGRQVRADLLLVEDRIASPFAVAIEIKSQPPKQPKNYRDTFLQALDYVGADLVDQRIPKCPIRFAMVYQQRRRWKFRVGANETIDEEKISSIEMDAIELVFNPFHVGLVLCDDRGIGFYLGARLWSSQKGWGGELDRRLSINRLAYNMTSNPPGAIKRE